MSDRPHTLDAPYFDGTVVVRPNDVVAVYWGHNGGATLVLRGGGSMRVIDNDKTRKLAWDAGLA